MDVLPDDVLLEIFDIYFKDERTDAWQLLVHVCRRWRILVFQSPRRLNLRLDCSCKTPARDALDVWPALPLIVRGGMDSSSGMDNIIAALGRSNRVCEVFLFDVNRESKKVLAPMHVPFPELTGLLLFSAAENPLVIPDSFLGGSAPRLRHFSLSGIPFPGLPRLLLSATHLVNLGIFDIPHSGYFPPEAMVALFSVLSSLEALYLDFASHQSFLDWESRSLPPPKRSILPALTGFYFKGVTEYLEDLVTCIDAPQLNTLNIYFPHEIDLDIPQLAQFINRTPKLGKRDARVLFHYNCARVELPAESGILDISIPYFWSTSAAFVHRAGL